MPDQTRLTLSLVASGELLVGVALIVGVFTHFSALMGVIPHGLVGTTHQPVYSILMP